MVFTPVCLRKERGKQAETGASPTYINSLPSARVLSVQCVKSVDIPIVIYRSMSYLLFYVLTTFVLMMIYHICRSEDESLSVNLTEKRGSETGDGRCLIGNTTNARINPNSGPPMTFVAATPS